MDDIGYFVVYNSYAKFLTTEYLVMVVAVP